MRFDREADRALALADHIFRNVEVLIYIFDIESRELSRDLVYFRECIDAIRQNSSDAKVFCLVHKMDLVPEEQRDQVVPWCNLFAPSAPEGSAARLVAGFQKARSRASAA